MTMTAGEWVAYVLLALTLTYIFVSRRTKSYSAHPLKNPVPLKNNSPKANQVKNKPVLNHTLLRLREQNHQLRHKNYQLAEEIKTLLQNVQQQQQLQAQLTQDLNQLRSEKRELATAAAAAAAAAVPVTAQHDEALLTLEKEFQTAMHAVQEHNAHLQAQERQNYQQMMQLREQNQILRRKNDASRRVELLNKAKANLVEDKLRQTSKDYYNVLSENALLRGEVMPLPYAVSSPTAKTP